MTENAVEFPQPDAAPDSVGRRQQGIAERRRRLVRAASELIAENENGNFSMPQLAERAGVSLATPYNLFGSKAAVLSQVFEAQVRAFHRDSASSPSVRPAERIFQAIGRLVSVYEEKPIFFRNLVRALYSLRASEHGQFPFPADAHLVRPLIQSLVDDGCVPHIVPQAVLEANLTRIFDVTFERWALQDWSIDRLHRELRASFALVFYGLLAPVDRPLLEQAIQEASIVD